MGNSIGPVIESTCSFWHKSPSRQREQVSTKQKKNRENRGKKWIGESGRRRRRGGGGGVRTQNRDSEGGCVLCEIKDAQNMHTWKQIRDRESGKLRAGSFANCIKSSRVSQLQLSNHKDVVSAHKGAINSLQVLYYSHSHAHIFFFEHFSF